VGVELKIGGNTSFIIHICNWNDVNLRDGLVIILEGRLGMGRILYFGRVIGWRGSVKGEIW
jgi:hypothetical protein